MYNSPIRIITSDLGMKVTEALDEQIYQSVLNVGIDVDKGELLRALQYDRNQYAKGYADAKAELLRCKDCRDCEMCYPEKRLDKEATQAWYLESAFRRQKTGLERPGNG